MQENILFTILFILNKLYKKSMEPDRRWITKCTGCPNKHGNRAMTSRSSLFRMSIVISNWKRIQLRVGVYFMLIVQVCSVILQDKQ